MYHPATRHPLLYFLPHVGFLTDCTAFRYLTINWSYLTMKTVFSNIHKAFRWNCCTFPTLLQQATNNNTPVAVNIWPTLPSCSTTALFPRYCCINTFSRAEMNPCTTHKRKRRYDIQQNLKTKWKPTCALNGYTHVGLSGPILLWKVVQCRVRVGSQISCVWNWRHEELILLYTSIIITFVLKCYCGLCTRSQLCIKKNDL